ncbi:hypothetical protein [Sphingomonas sp. GC_Shp_5]
MTVVHWLGPIRFDGSVDTEYPRCGDAPVDTFIIRVEQPQVGGKMGFEMRTVPLTTRLNALRRQMRDLEAMEQAVMAAPDRQMPEF